MNIPAPVAHLDRTVTVGLQPTRRSRTLGAGTAAFSIAGDSLLITLLAVAAARARAPRAAVAVLGGTLLAEQAVLAAVKRALPRDRPEEEVRPPVALHPSGAGFPSGHTSSGFFSATVLADRESGPALFALASATSLTRLHQGVHRASDLLAGAVLGTAAGGVARVLASRVP